MYHTKINNNPQNLSNTHIPITLFFSFIIHFFILGCATAYHRDDSIRTILTKENDVIEKLKAERSDEKLSKTIKQNDKLNRAEVHLLLSLDEIQKANEVISTKLLQLNKTEVKNGKN